MDNKKTLRYLAGVCFAVDAFLIIKNVLEYAEYGFSFLGFLAFVGVILVAVSMFISMPILNVVGCGIYILVLLIGIFNELKYTAVVIEVLKYDIPHVAFWVLLLLTSVIPKMAKQLGIAAGIMMGLYFIVYLSDVLTYFNSLDAIPFIEYLRYIVLIAGGCLAGLSVEEDMPNSAAVSFSFGQSSTGNNANYKIAHNTDDRVARLKQVKSLLDQNIITRDEFERTINRILEG